MGSLLVLVCLSGCVTLGPKVERRVVFVHTITRDGRVIEVGRVGKNVKVPIVFKDADGNEFLDEQDIGGWGLVHPNAMKEAKK